MTAEPGWKFPTHCADCGVLLEGGATQHAEGCAFLELVREHFPGFNPPAGVRE